MQATVAGGDLRVRLRRSGEVAYCTVALGKTVIA